MEKANRIAEGVHTFYAVKDVEDGVVSGWDEVSVQATLSEVPECLRKSISLINLMDKRDTCEFGGYFDDIFSQGGRVYWVVVTKSVSKSWQKLWGKEE
jgi:hypothetical protein